VALATKRTQEDVQRGQKTCYECYECYVFTVFSREFVRKREKMEQREP